MSFKYNPIEGSFDLVGSSSQGNIKVENVLLTSLDITNKQITLSQTPLNPLEVVLDIPSGITQAYGLDFIVSANVLDWDGYGLETILSQNDRLRIIYQY
jgi:hypothetical protein